MAIALVSVPVSVMADPVAALGYSIEIVRLPGAILAGLAREEEALLATNLADGRLYRRGADGRFLAFGPQLPHGADVMGDPTGPFRVAAYGSGHLVAQGWPPSDKDEGALDHALLEVSAKGEIRIISNDFWNPYAFTVAGDSIYVIDAARNSVEQLSYETGARKTLFTFARLKASASDLQALSPTEFAGEEGYEFDAVPTGVADREHRLYVSLFGGFPFVAGSGRIVSLPMDAATEARIEVDDLNAPVDVGFDSAGHIFVLEHGLFDQAGGWIEDSGRLLRIDPASGERRTLLDRLDRPVSLLVWDEKRLIVSQLGEEILVLTRDGPE